jgi:hypothetical protein
VEILKRSGRFPDIKVDGKQVKIKMTSALAKAEEQEDFSSFQVWFAQMQLLDPETLAIGAKVENFPSWTAKKLGLPLDDLVRTEEEQKEKAQQVAKLLQQQQEAQGGGEVNTEQ